MSSHLTLDERITIQEGLDKRLSLRTIAKMTNKAPSTIMREIALHKSLKGKRIPNEMDPCAHKHECQIYHLCKDIHCNAPCKSCSTCRTICSRYTPDSCKRLQKSPFVCNGCEKFNICMFNRVMYYATYAHNSYQNTLISSREGINQDPDSLQQIDSIVSPLICKGQSIAHIFANHKNELNCSRATLYRYIDKSVLSARNIDLPRKVKYKKRKEKSRLITEEQRLSILSRNYDRFLAFTKENPGIEVVEMDTVIGKVDTSKVLLTLLFRSCNLMLAILLPNKSQDSVITALNDICERIGIDVFQKLFPVILTDRGTEFLYPEALECDSNGEIKTRIFYCDPQCSWQKGQIEKNHELIRYVIPKGSSFDDYSQADITLMINHVNSLGRDKFNGASPYLISRVMLNNKLHEAMGLVEIKPDDVNLKPSLLKTSR